MTAFWVLFALFAYGMGVLGGGGGLVTTLRNLLGKLGSPWGDPWVAQFPILGRFDLATFIVLVILAAGGVLLHRLLNKPRAADLLIETESELKKVTWPSLGETWNGSIAVIVTVIALMVYLSATDVVVAFVLVRAMGG